MNLIVQTNTIKIFQITNVMPVKVIAILVFQFQIVRLVKLVLIFITHNVQISVQKKLILTLSIYVPHAILLAYNVKTKSYVLHVF